MSTPESLIEQIRTAFEDTPYPGDHALRCSDMGDEPFLLEQEFRGKTDWRVLSPEFLDQAPDGFGSALSFFSPEAFRFYLPAYLIAGLEDRLERSDPTFALCFGFDDGHRDLPVNPRLYGERTWLELKREAFARFTPTEAAAVVAYLRFQREHSEMGALETAPIDCALRHCWLRLAGLD